MKKWQLIKELEKFDDELEIFVKISNGVGNITEVESVDADTYGFFGGDEDCIMLGFESKCESDCDNCTVYCNCNTNKNYTKEEQDA